MTPLLSRRQFVAGSLTVSFTAAALARSDVALAQAQAVKLPGSLANNARLDSWLKIGADGQVTIFTGKAEIGQGIKTALAQIAADELDVSIERIAIVGADTARTPEEGVTSRSFSVIESGSALRLAAAEARSLLLAKAAAKLSVPVERLGVTDGAIAAGQKKTSYWELIGGKEFKHQLTGMAKPKQPKDYKYVGYSVPRVDLPGKVTGKPSYVQDLRLDGMLHARVLRPPLDRADIAIDAIDATRTSAMPGMRKIVRNGNFVAVVAEREEQAINALAALKKDTRWRVPVLPKPEDLKDYLLKAPAKDRVLREDGDVAAALAKAQHVVDAKFFVPYHAHASIAPSCAVAQLSGDQLTIWTHS